MKDTDQVMEALRQRYGGNAYAFFEQVRDAAGFNAGRTADAVAMSLWPSRGLHLHGFEVKSDRRDWIREYRNPAKAESVNRYCDFWWLVVSDRAMVKEDELPATWGLLAPNKKGDLAVIRQAPLLTPAEIDRSFLACLLRRAYEARPAAKEIEGAFARGKKEGAAAQVYRRDNLQAELEKVSGMVATFERASGLRISRWEGPERIGEAVRQVLEGKHLVAISKIEQVEESLARLLTVVREERAKLQPVELEVPA